MLIDSEFSLAFQDEMDKVIRTYRRSVGMSGMGYGMPKGRQAEVAGLVKRHGKGLHIFHDRFAP